MIFQLVIFDCDGVLVDTESISNTIFAEMLTEIGLPITKEDCIDLFVGRSPKTNLETIHRLLGTAPPADFFENYWIKVHEACEKNLQPVPGIKAALEAISAPICVASSGEPDIVQKNLALTKLLDRFEGKIFSASHVARGKPAPDLFLHAAKEMKINPEYCAVIEDSVSGVQAGRAAGMTVFGYTGTFKGQTLQEAGAHVVFDDMRNLPEYLQEYDFLVPSRNSSSHIS